MCQGLNLNSLYLLILGMVIPPPIKNPDNGGYLIKPTTKTLRIHSCPDGKRNIFFRCPIPLLGRGGLYIYIYLYIYMYIPKNPWTLQWKGLNLYRRGPGSQNSYFWGVRILRDICVISFRKELIKLKRSSLNIIRQVMTQSRPLYPQTLEVHD